MLLRMAKISVCVLLLLAPVSLAQTQPVHAPVAATQPAAQAEGLRVVIVQVSGLVQVRAGANLPWQAATQGMEVGQGSEFRTGPHSLVTCTIPPDQTFTLDRLGVVKVAEAMQQGNKASTRLVMPYGRTTYQLQSSGPEYDSEILTPSSTLAVRGTTVSVYDQPPFAPEATSFTGRALYRTASGTVSVGAKDGKKAVVRATDGTSSQTALDNTVVDPSYGSLALTAADAQLIASEVARGGVVSYNPIAQIPVITDSTPPTNRQLLREFPGPLDFVVRWTGDADIDLIVAAVHIGNPRRLLDRAKNPFEHPGPRPIDVLYPGFGLNVSPDGGREPFDNIGGPHGGDEIAYYPNVEHGIYGIAAVFISGQPTPITLDTFLNGKYQDEYFLAGPYGTTLDHSKSVKTNLSSPGQFQAVQVYVPEFNPPIPSSAPNNPVRSRRP